MSPIWLSVTKSVTQKESGAREASISVGGGVRVRGQNEAVEIALVVYDGVLADECDAFRSVLSKLQDARLETVAADRSPRSGPGGHQTVDRTLAELMGDASADVVIVPGGIGCERACDDEELRRFLQHAEQTATLLAASSTGTVVLASAGLLHGDSAATHWLAGDLLRRYGSDTDGRRLVVRRNVVTCEGRLSAVDAAFALVDRLAGPNESARIRSVLLENGTPLLTDPPRWRRLVAEVGRRIRVPALQSADEVPDATTPLSVMVELVDDPAEVRKMRRRARHR